MKALSSGSTGFRTNALWSTGDSRQGGFVERMRRLKSLWRQGSGPSIETEVLVSSVAIDIRGTDHGV
jgi:hypothetical protein